MAFCKVATPSNLLVPNFFGKTYVVYNKIYTRITNDVSSNYDCDSLLSSCFFTMYNFKQKMLVDLVNCLGGGVMVSVLDFGSEGRWFDAQSLPSCCFLRQDTLPRIVSLHPGV